MNGHTLRFSFDGWLKVEAVCHEPDGADCRLTSIDCECEQWGSIQRRDDGTIWHEVYQWEAFAFALESPQWHQVKPADHCNIAEFINMEGGDGALELAQDDVRFTIADVPISASWSTDGYYQWRPVSDDSEPRVIPSRTTDPETSHAAAREIKIRAGSQRARLLQAFAYWQDDAATAKAWAHSGLTDEEAMKWAIGVSSDSEYSKRCSELREAGYIEPTGETRTGSSGLQRIVSRITEKGRAAVRDL